MSKSVIILLAGLFISNSIYSQDKKHEIGVEVNQKFGRISPSLNYLFSITPQHQLDFTASFSGGFSSQQNFLSATFSAYYKHKWNIVEGLNWYIGPGASIDYARNSNLEFQSTYLGIGMQTGMEYDFSKHNVPIVIGMDVTPEYKFGQSSSFFDLNAGFSVRFKF